MFEKTAFVCIVLWRQVEIRTHRDKWMGIIMLVRKGLNKLWCLIDSIWKSYKNLTCAKQYSCC